LGGCCDSRTLLTVPILLQQQQQLGRLLQQQDTADSSRVYGSNLSEHRQYGVGMLLGNTGKKERIKKIEY
jgi:hypothetical protein